MKRKRYTRPVSVVLTDEMFNSIQVITDAGDVGISDYIRDAVQEKLEKDNKNSNQEKK